LTDNRDKSNIVTMTIWTPDLAAQPGPRYAAIAAALAGDIKVGRLKPGERLPTHRDLAYRLGVTIGTVTRAYSEAEARGLIKGEVGRGTYVRGTPTALERFTFPDPNPQARQPVDLSRNIPWRGENDSLLAAALTELAQRPGIANLLTYQPHRGLPQHRAAGAAWIARTSRMQVSPEQVLVTCGGQHAMATALGTLARPGDAILTEALTYPGLRILGDFMQLRLHGVAMDEQGLLPDAFEAACRSFAPKAVYCMPTLQNPTGAVMPEARRRAIAAIAEAHGVAIIEDDIYGFLLPEGPAPLVTHAPRIGHYISSTSKSMAPGLRIGFLSVPEGREPAFATSLRAMTWMAPPLAAEVAALWIEDGTADRFAAWRREESIARQAMARAAFAGFDYRAYPGAFHGWLVLPPSWRAQAFEAKAREREVLVTAVEAFAVSPVGEQAVRVCLGGVVSREELARGLAVLSELLAAAPHAPAAADRYAEVL
jgi:DNA-binding transcriptional MocR family regulator